MSQRYSLTVSALTSTTTTLWPWRPVHMYRPVAKEVLLVLKCLDAERFTNVILPSSLPSSTQLYLSPNKTVVVCLFVFCCFWNFKLTAESIVFPCLDIFFYFCTSQKIQEWYRKLPYGRGDPLPGRCGGAPPTSLMHITSVTWGVHSENLSQKWHHQTVKANMADLRQTS